MVDNTKRNDALVIAQALAAVRREMLPGLEIAWDKAGPATLLVAELLIADLWVTEGYPLEELVAGIKAYVTVPELKPA
jgi:hypothetical protein